MDLGSLDRMNAGGAAAQLAEGMTERIRAAHHEAGQQAEADSTSVAGGREVSSPPAPGVLDSESVGAHLRIRLETIVADIISPVVTDPADLLGKVVDLVVADRLERSGIPEGHEYHRLVAEQLRSDPVVVAEVDEILQTIARQMAYR